MNKEITVLNIEDLEDDTLLIKRALVKGGFTPEMTRVETPEALREALQQKDWDIILSDYSLPGFNGLNALTIARESTPEIPFILVSGAVGEEVAVEIMRQGARDYVMKDKLSRLPPVIERELAEAARHKEQFKDKEEKSKLEEQLRQAYKMEAIGTLAGGIAHDFNNLLTVIIGYTDMAKYGLPESSETSQCLDQVLKAGQSAKNLVKQILTFSRKSPETLSPLLPLPIIKEALKFMRASLPTTIEIREDISPDTSSIIANPTNIHQILVNLCTNAFHAMDKEKGTLTVKFYQEELTREDLIDEPDIAPGPFVHLAVSDTGSGIDKKTMARIFEPYFTTKEIGKGSGMGLSLVHGIVYGGEGFIKVESEPGHGSTFHVYFPVVEDSAAQIEEVFQGPLPGGTERILIVDDEQVIASVFQKTLSKLGYLVTTECSSERAIELFRTSPESFDLVITDQTMPQITGAELAGIILKIRPDLPVIICTGYSSILTEEMAQEIGVRQILMKPVSRSTLALTIRKAFNNHPSP